MEEFIRRLPRCAEALSGYEQDGNRKTFAALEEQLQKAAEFRGHWKMRSRT